MIRLTYCSIEAVRLDLCKDKLVLLGTQSGLIGLLMETVTTASL